MTNEELVTRIKAGVDTAENMLALWEQNKRFIYSIAKQYKGLAEMDDMEQEGYLALYDAIDGYDPEEGYKFLTYAQHWIKQRIVRYIQNNGTIRIPVYESEKLREYKKLVNAYLIYLGRKPTRHEIVSQMGVPYKTVIELEKAAQMTNLISMDSLLTMDDSLTVGETIPDDVDIEDEVLEGIQNDELKDVLWSMVDALPEQQGEVIRKRFQEEKSLRNIGKDIGATLACVRAIEAKALRELRSTRNMRLLRPFLIDERAYGMAFSGIGVGMFNKTWTSSTERAAMWLHEKKQKEEHASR